MTKADHLRMAWLAVPVVLLFLAYMVTQNTYVALMVCMAVGWWIMTLLRTTKPDGIHTWWVGDGHGNGVTIYAATEQEAIARCAVETFDMRAEYIGPGEIP